MVFDYISIIIASGITYSSRWLCHGEYGPTLNRSGGTNYGCHKRSPPAITGPGRTIRGNKIIVKKRVRVYIFGERARPCSASACVTDIALDDVAGYNIFFFLPYNYFELQKTKQKTTNKK